ncbi:MAG: LLM class F420-dependent oxidoreductase [Acidimicrobiia bacterium]
MVEYPLLSEVDGGAFLNPANVARFARAAESAGIDGLALTDHPAPSKKWLMNGGHETLDPFVGLGFAAAVTEHIKLMTFLTVVPYRNPFVTTKSMTAVDVLSGGRTIFAVGTGYLRSEFAALGVDFDERNELFDEAIEVMRGLWTTDEFHFDGRHFKAMGVTLAPTAVQKPHPPLWLGGNAKVVLRRVADWGDGWAPLLGSEQLSKTARSPFIANDDELGTRILELKDAMTARGRDADALDVLAKSIDLPADASLEHQIDTLGHLGELGVTWSRMSVRHDRFESALEDLETFGSEVIATTRGRR